MKTLHGVILAGGQGTRLRPLTLSVNKHLLPIGCYPLVMYPFNSLLSAGIKKISIVTNEVDFPAFYKLFKGYQNYVSINYFFQGQSRGIADALKQVKSVVSENEKLVVILGDNIFTGKITLIVEQARDSDNALIVLKEVTDPTQYGVANIKNEKLLSIIEKPQPINGKHISKYAVLGLYVYESDVFKIINHLPISWRNEYEITDVNNQYIAQGKMEYVIYSGGWFDAGRSIRDYVEISYKFRDVELSNVQ